MKQENIEETLDKLLEVEEMGRSKMDDYEKSLLKIFFYNALKATRYNTFRSDDHVKDLFNNMIACYKVGHTRGLFKGADQEKLFKKHKTYWYEDVGYNPNSKLLESCYSIHSNLKNIKRTVENENYHNALKTFFSSPGLVRGCNFIPESNGDEFVKSLNNFIQDFGIQICEVTDRGYCLYKNGKKNN